MATAGGLSCLIPALSACNVADISCSGGSPPYTVTITDTSTGDKFFFAQDMAADQTFSVSIVMGPNVARVRLVDAAGNDGFVDRAVTASSNATCYAYASGSRSNMTSTASTMQDAAGSATLTSSPTASAVPVGAILGAALGALALLALLTCAGFFLLGRKRARKTKQRDSIPSEDPFHTQNKFVYRRGSKGGAEETETETLLEAISPREGIDPFEAYTVTKGHFVTTPSNSAPATPRAAGFQRPALTIVTTRPTAISTSTQSTQTRSFGETRAAGAAAAGSSRSFASNALHVDPFADSAAVGSSKAGASSIPAAMPAATSRPARNSFDAASGSSTLLDPFADTAAFIEPFIIRPLQTSVASIPTGPTATLGGTAKGKAPAGGTAAELPHLPPRYNPEWEETRRDRYLNAQYLQHKVDILNLGNYNK